MIFDNSPLKKKITLLCPNSAQLSTNGKSNFLRQQNIYIKIYSIQYTTLSMIIYFQICTKGKPLSSRTKGLVFFQTRAGLKTSFLYNLVRC